MFMDRLQGHLCGDFWLGWASSGYSGTRLLCLETQLCLIPDGSPSMGLGINLPTLLCLFYSRILLDWLCHYTQRQCDPSPVWRRSFGCVFITEQHVMCI